MMYYEGYLFKKDYAKASKCLERAKTKGLAIAYQNLGRLYENGHGVVKNLLTAAKYYQEAMDRGYQEARDRRVYSGIPNDLDRLLTSTEISAADLNSLGMMYYQASGIKLDYAKAKWCFESFVLF